MLLRRAQQLGTARNDVTIPDLLDLANGVAAATEQGRKRSDGRPPARRRGLRRVCPRRPRRRHAQVGHLLDGPAARTSCAWRRSRLAAWPAAGWTAGSPRPRHRQALFYVALRPASTRRASRHRRLVRTADQPRPRQRSYLQGYHPAVHTRRVPAGGGGHDHERVPSVGASVVRPCSLRWSCAAIAVRASRLSLLRTGRFADRPRGQNSWSAARAQSRIPARTDAPSPGPPRRSHRT
ncbi:hypothetical protein [Streptomyces sp. NBC_00057]|uniref:SbtR family transcriptional regulator n=1 Tax=Streptomyces sp. NBC_00057 TaxID=2975634 RepID=UPI0038701F9F